MFNGSQSSRSFALVPDVESFTEVDNVLGNIDGVIGDSLQALRRDDPTGLPG